MSPQLSRLRTAFLGALFLYASWARADAPDPAHHWWTLETPHFELHFHEGEEHLAQRAARAAEAAHLKLTPILEHDPSGKTQIVLSDDTDSANGMATAFLGKRVWLYGVPPDSLSEMNDYRDWVETLVSHEYTHVLHTDTVEGVPRLANQLFGQMLVPNGLTPAWMIEGIAILHEADPGAGRNHSALFDMYARAEFTEGPGLRRLDQASNPSLDWPAGNLPYLLGSRFVLFLNERYGPESIAAFFHEVGGWLWPYALNTAAEHHFGGKSFDELWAEFDVALSEKYRAQLSHIRERPVTVVRPITRRGARVLHPRFSPDGAFVVVFDRGLDERAGLRRFDLEGNDLGRAAAVEQNGTFGLLSSAEAIVAVTDVYREFRKYDDLYRVDLESGKRRRITSGERATDPDVLPGGSSVVYVARVGDGEHALRRMPADGGPSETLYSRAGAQIYMPRWSPDGGRVAFELQIGGRRDIAIWSSSGVVRITDDDAIDTGPSWSPDGRRLFFSSDRGGVYNLYAWEAEENTSDPDPQLEPNEAPPLAAGRLRQVTNVETGAFEPAVSPDGRTLAWVTYSRNGYDLAVAPVDPSMWLDPTPAEPRPAAPASVTPAADYAVRPYRAWETILPRFWLPMFGYDAAGFTAGFFSSGSDAVGLHAWTLDLRYSFEARDVDYALGYSGAWMYPSVALVSQRTIGTAPGHPDQLELIWTPARIGFSLPHTRLDHSYLLTFGWAGTIYRAIDGVAPPSPSRPVPFENGFASQVSLGVAFGNATRFTRSISNEEGRRLSLSARYSPHALGSDFEYVTVRGSISQYVRLPATRHSVLALRASGGIARGSIGGRAPFDLGGPAYSSDPLEIIFPEETSGDLLRGYSNGAISGTRFVSTNMELRFPLADLVRGYSTWPVFLRRLHGTLFVDAGTAFVPGRASVGTEELPAWSSLHFGAGAELGLEVVLGYSIVTDMRVGVARGLGPLLAPWKGGRPLNDPLAITQVYFVVGQPF